MKTLFLIAALSVLSTPVQSSELRDSIEGFCQTVREANMVNIPMNPGSPMAYRIANQTHTTIPYDQLWAIAKATDIPACNQMW